MSISLSTEDMLHILELLREDRVCCEQTLMEEPENLEASISLNHSKAIMLKVAAFAILKGHKLDDYDNTDIFQGRTRLN